MCLRVSEPLQARQADGLLPEYSCLILSPANFWRRDQKRSGQGTSNKFLDSQTGCTVYHSDTVLTHDLKAQGTRKMTVKCQEKGKC